jgi:hypothetical protein
LPDRDEAGARALIELRDASIWLPTRWPNPPTISAGSSACCAPNWRFYVGCLNLAERLAEKGEPVCLPSPNEPLPTSFGQDLYQPHLRRHR